MRITILYFVITLKAPHILYPVVGVLCEVVKFETKHMEI